MNSKNPKKAAPRGRVRKAVQLAGLVVFGIVVGVLLVEGASRLLWKAPWYEQLIAVQMRLQEYEYKRNLNQLRDRDYAVRKPPGKKRILMFGDSFTFGMGVPEDDKIFPSIIEHRLNERAFDGAPEGIELLNAGLPATLTGDWLELWERFGWKFDPDVVVVVFFLRDGSETLFIPEFFMRIRRDIVARNDRSTWYGKSYTFRIVRDQLDRTAIAREYTKRFIDAYFGTPVQTAEWQRARRNLGEMRRQVERRGAKMALVIFPVLVQLNDDYPFREICDLLESFGEGMNVPVYNLLTAFEGRNASDLWVSPWDQHPNVEGHAIVADALMPFMTELLEEP